jgi:hypothetical protein
MIKITLTKAPTSLLECAGYISGRKKLIQAMSLNIDRPINRAVVVGCAIFTTHNYLKLHMSRTLKVPLGNTHAKTRKLWQPSTGLRLSKRYPSINSLAVHCLHFHTPAERPTALSFPQYADIARRLVLASRLPSRASPALNPHSARC